MDRTTFLSIYKDRELIHLINVTHSISEAAPNISVSISVEFVLLLFVWEHFHISPWIFLIFHIYLEGSGHLVDFDFDFGVIPPKTIYFSEGKSFLHLNHIDSHIAELRVIYPANKNLFAFIRGRINLRAGRTDWSKTHCFFKGIFGEVFLKVNLEKFNSYLGLSRLDNSELRSFINHFGFKLFFCNFFYLKNNIVIFWLDGLSDCVKQFSPSFNRIIFVFL